MVFRLALLLSIIDVFASQVAWKAFNLGGSRSGVNTAETQITASNVGSLVLQWKVTLQDTIDSSPILFPNVSTSAGTKEVMVLNSQNAGILYALDANSGEILWQNTIAGGSGGCNKCGQTGEYTRSTPIIDQDSEGLWVYAYRLDGYVHKYDLATGIETIKPPFPAQITLIRDVEQGASALNIFGGYLYMTIGGYCGDCGHYVGHVVAVSLTTNEIKVWNSLCSNKQELLTSDSSQVNYCPDKESGIWSRAGTVLDPLDGNVLVATGNGNFNANLGGFNYGDSIIKLANGLPSSIPVDSYTPSNYQQMDIYDLDLGSTSPCILPTQNQSKTPYMLVQGSKDKTIRLINRQDLSGQGCCGHVGGEIFNISWGPGGNIFTQPLAWLDPDTGLTWVFIVNDNGFVAYNVVTDQNGVSSLKIAYSSSAIKGTSPVMANNILFVQTSTAIRALDPKSGSVLWTSSNSGPLKWQSPIVVNGHVYAVDNAAGVYAWELPASSAKE